MIYTAYEIITSNKVELVYIKYIMYTYREFFIEYWKLILFCWIRREV